MNVKEFLTALLGKTLNMPADKVASLVTDDGKEVKAEALTELLSMDAERVQKFKADNQTYFENGQKKATKELMSDNEKKWKEKYGITSDKKGDELLDEIITAKSNDKSAIDEVKVKSHEAYVNMQNELNKKLVEGENNWKLKFDQQQKDFAKKETFGGVLKTADPILAGFALPEDEKLKANQKRLLELDLGQFDYEPHGDNDFLVKTKEGKLLEDGHGNRITYEALVKQTAGKYWLPIQGQQRSGSGGKNNGEEGKGKQGTTWQGKTPTNDAEYKQAIMGAKDSSERIQIQDAYKAHKEGGAK